jgi:hypothetical protein
MGPAAARDGVASASRAAGRGARERAAGSDAPRAGQQREAA